MDNTKDDTSETEIAKVRRKPKKALLQVVGLVFLLLILMVTSVVTALMAVGVIDIFPDDNGPVASMTDAQLICDRELQSEHGDLMQAFVLDDLSSHSDDKSGGYKMYYEINMYRDASRNTGVKRFFVNCFVTAGGRVKRLDLFEDQQYVPKAIRRTRGNAIGL